MILIDLYATSWQHYEFNKQFSKLMDNSDVFLGYESADYFGEISNKKLALCQQNIRIILIELWRQKDICFVVCMNNYLPLIFICMLFQKNTSYVIHKYNNVTRHKTIHNLIYQALEFLGLQSISFEPPPKCYKNNKILEVDLWDTGHTSLATTKSIDKNIAFVGKPANGKKFEYLLELAEEYSLIIHMYVDNFECSEKNVIVLEHTNNISCCSAIWGFYEPRIYSGIQSGLVYPSLVAGIPIITNKNVGFQSFSFKHPNHCISLEEYLAEVSS